MNTKIFRRSTMAICFVACLAMVGTKAEARGEQTDTENCWRASFDAYCDSHWSTRCSDGTYHPSCRHYVDGDTSRFGRLGGGTLESCQATLHQLLIDAAYEDCQPIYETSRCHQFQTDCPDAAPGPVGDGHEAGDEG